MNINPKNIKFYLPVLLAVSVVAGIFLGKMLIRKSEEVKQYRVYSQQDKVSKVLSTISNNYVDSVSRKQLTETAIHAMLDSLDPHSVYIPAKELKEVNEPLEGEFSGIGIQFNMIEDTIRVIKTIPNGPSEKVGIMAGDKIVEINDSVVAGKGVPTNEIVSRLKGKKGTRVEVGIKRRGVNEVIDFEITRDEIPLKSVDVSYMITDSTGYIKLSNFSRKTHKEFNDAVMKLSGKGMENVILDLRKNGGGYMGAAISIADALLSEGQLIVYTNGRYSEKKKYYATQEGLLQKENVVVLIDEFSVSASEIVAGAIQDNDRGVIVGRRSFGKGLVQQQISLDDGSALRLTVARYHTPTGRCIQKPYEQGQKDYYNELNQRYKEGEVFDKDSVHFADSLKYETPGGDTVYGGGGIMPDIYVPKDTSDISDYFAKVSGKGLIYKFSYAYADKHRQRLNQFEDWQQLDNYLDKQDLVSDFVAYAGKNGVEKDSEGIREAEKYLKARIKANVARNIMGNEGYYPIIRQVDNILQKAVAVSESK